MMDNDKVLFRNVAFSYRGSASNEPVLADVSFEINRGETVVAVGPNGVGKSTLLGVLTGTLEPARGTVIVFGKRQREARIGMVWQQCYASLYPWWNAWENAALPLRLRGVGRAEQRRRVAALCEELGFEQTLDRPPYELSGGEVQKLAVVRALLAEPELLLMDEPFASLSFDASLELMRHIQVVQARKNLAVLMVSHFPEYSIFMADVLLRLPRKPVRLNENDRLEVKCPHARPRPIEWMFEPSFREQVHELKNAVAVEP